MPLLYRAVQSSLKNKEGKNQWYPRLVKTEDTMDVYELGREISKRSSMTIGDALNVVETAVDIITQTLMNSRSVCLDRLGTMTVICQAKGNGVDTADEVTSDQIAKLKVRFTPSTTYSKFNGRTRTMFQEASFMRIDAPKPLKNGENETPGGNDDDDDYVDPNA